MRICLIIPEVLTNQLQRLLNKFSSEIPSSFEIEFLKIPIKIASILDENTLINYIIENNYINYLKKFDIIVVPGFLKGNLNKINSLLNKSVVKGPKNLPDIIPMFKAIEKGIKLSNEETADKYIQEFKKEFEFKILSNLDKYLPKIGEFGKNLKISIYRHRPIIIAEVVDAVLLSENEFIKKCRYYIEEGADIIDIGCLAYKAKPEKLKTLIKIFRQNFPDKLLSVDTFNIDEIRIAIYENVDLILSISKSTFYKLENDLYDCSIVLIPENEKIPDIIKEFKELIPKFENRKIQVILDPIFKPPMFNIFNSLLRYYILKKVFPDKYFLIGLGNVTELLDVDSIGVNALLTLIAIELGIEFILTTEASVKTIGSVNEIRKAIDMFTITKILNKLPKDTTINLLICKKKYY